MRVMNAAPINLLFSMAVLIAAYAPPLAHHTGPDIDAKIKELVRKVDGNKPSFVILGRTDSTVSGLIYRAQTGEAELHDRFADFFVVKTGRGTVVIGGKLVKQRQVGPGEMAAERIEGGVRRVVGPGDVLYIPPRTPHHVVLATDETIAYLILKVKE